jgi:hypothetical protein
VPPPLGAGKRGREKGKEGKEAGRKEGRKTREKAIRHLSPIQNLGRYQNSQ